MTSHEFAEVVKAVQEYWGEAHVRNAFGPAMQELACRRFSEWTLDELLRDLVRARTHDMGSIKPPWDMIYSARKRDSKPRRH